MIRPNLSMVAQWIDSELVTSLAERRRLKGEWHR